VSNRFGRDLRGRVLLRVVISIIWDISIGRQFTLILPPPPSSLSSSPHPPPSPSLSCRREGIMADDNSNNPSSSSSAPPRPKPPRSATVVGTVRPRNSSPSDQNGDGRPPTKRARKPINCEPCRNSKLKCDRFVCRTLCYKLLSNRVFLSRNRPCSSCVLRGPFLP